MKYIEKKCQSLIEDMERAYDNVCDTLKYHINELQKIIAEKDEEIDKLKEGNKLQAEIDEYNRLEAQNNMNLEDEITHLRAKLNETESELAVMKANAVLHHCGEGEPKVYKPKTRKKRSKNIVVYCKDCGTYFQAKSKIAKYCSSCRDKRAKASRAKWLAKQK